MDCPSVLMNKLPAQGLKTEDQMRLRGMMIETVLATDMKRHFNILSRFQVCMHHLSCSLYERHTSLT